MTHEAMFGEARWLGGDGQSQTPCFRASFAVPSVRTAKITICGLGYFELYLNGRRVSEDLFVPVTSDYAPRPITVNGQPFDEEMGHRCYCLQYDVGDWLLPGENQLAVALGPGFFAQETWSYDGSVSFGPVRLCYRVTWTDAEGRSGEYLSGPDARWRQGEVARCDFFQGEKQDLNLLPVDWTTADFSVWSPVALLPPLKTDYQLQDCPADRIVRQITPRLIGRFPAVRIYDAGENITGWVVLRDGEEKGGTIQVRFSESLSACGALDEHYMHDQYLDVTSDGTGRTVHPRFTWHGFRYFSVSGQAEVLSVAVIHSDVRPASDFVSASPVLNWLYDAYRRTQLCNLHGGIPSDCPHLERRGYTGDGQLTLEAALLTLNHRTFVRKWLRDIQDCQDKNTGHVQYTAPYHRCGGGPGGWGCAIVTAPLQYYRYYGEDAPLRDMYPGMCRYVDYLRAHSVGGLVTSDRPGEWCLGDWCAPGQTKLDPPFVNTCFLLQTLSMLREIAGILGEAARPEWTALEAEARRAVMEAYYDPQTGDFAGNREGANAFALTCGLGGEKTWESLVRHYTALEGYDTGIFGTELVTRLLLERGETALAFRLLTSENPASFAGWMRAGATTLWEYWPGDRQRSLSHPMFGAVVKELFHYALGVRQTEGGAGWRSVRIAPAFVSQLPWARGTIQTPRGEIRVAYTVLESGFQAEVQLPPGITATFCWQGREVLLTAGENRLLL